MNTVVTQFAAEETGASGIGALGIDPKAFVIQLITFLIVYLVLKKFVFKRIVDALQKRQETISQGVRLTTELTAEREKLEKEVEATHKTARQEADRLIADTKERASSIIKEAEESASKKIEMMMADAKKRIEEESARARRELEGEIVDLVIKATEAVAEEKIDAQKDSALIARALKGQA